MSRPTTKAEGRSLRIPFFLLISALPFSAANAESAAPEIVQVDEVTFHGDVKRVTMGSDTGRYVLFCNLKAAGCGAGAPQMRYYLFTANTRLQMPGAKQPIDLEFVQDWTVSYPNGKNIGLVPVTGSLPSSLGMFVLESWSKR